MTEIEILQRRVRDQELAIKALVMAFTNGSAGGPGLALAIDSAAETLKRMGESQAAGIIHGGMGGTAGLTAA